MTLWSLLAFYIIVGRRRPDKEQTREHRYKRERGMGIVNRVAACVPIRAIF